MTKTKPLIFIVGVGRSGTSLLQSMLASHPKIKFLPETAYIRRYLTNKELNFIFENCGKDSAMEVLEKDSLLNRLDMNIKELINPALEKHKRLDLAIYEEILEASDSGEVIYLGDKDPKLIEHLPMLKRLFSRAHVIHIIRDPRDVLTSKKKAEWSKSGHPIKHIFANRAQLKIGRKNGPKYFGERYKEIFYEKLIGFPRETLEDICNFLNLEFSESMLSFSGEAKRLVSKSEMSWKKETLGPLLRDNIEKWKTELSSKEIALTELACEEAFLIGKYQKQSPFTNLNAFELVWTYLGLIAIKAGTPLYQIYKNVKA